MDIEIFRSFNKITNISKMQMTITQKIHGSNAQILIEKDNSDFLHNAYGIDEFRVLAGSRTRWLSPDNDNYGFCKWVMQNRKELIEKLGSGRHYGEWAGNGINSGEGLKEKTFCLFNHRRFNGSDLPNRVTTVPVLYEGDFSFEKIQETMDLLKEHGSYLVDGYMNPEGIVIEVDEVLYKKVFETEETHWREADKIKVHHESMDVSHLLQPIRLMKLLSRDESYIRDYPNSISRICSDYVKDLEEEKQFISTNEDDLKIEKRSLGKKVFYFVKTIVNETK